MTAFVVAMAGMMLPAADLTWKRLERGKWKMNARRLAAAVTKVREGKSSLFHSSSPWELARERSSATLK